VRLALERNSKLDADSIGVRIVNGMVVFTGTVASWAERDSAVAAAWAAPGASSMSSTASNSSTTEQRGRSSLATRDFSDSKGGQDL